ncbi:MAG: hypothetical protein P8J37_12000 [Fuerstiella sp.]|nr:hypothetical protein [Fuerstiella sp.]
MKFELNILNNGGDYCSSGDPADRQCGEHTACGRCSESPDDNSRRQFLTKASTIALGSLSLTLLPMSSDLRSDEPSLDNGDGSLADTGGEPADQTEAVVYGFLVDTERCVGTGKCLTACREENNVPEG